MKSPIGFMVAITGIAVALCVITQMTALMLRAETPRVVRVLAVLTILAAVVTIALLIFAATLASAKPEVGRIALPRLLTSVLW